MPATLQIEKVAKEKGVKITHLSKGTHIGADVMDRYWHNKAVQINLTVLSRIADFLGVKVTDLISDEK